MGFQMTKSLQQDTRVKLDPTIFRHAFSYVQSDEKWLPTQSVSLGYRPFLKKKIQTCLLKIFKSFATEMGIWRNVLDWCFASSTTE